MSRLTTFSISDFSIFFVFFAIQFRFDFSFIFIFFVCRQNIVRIVFFLSLHFFFRRLFSISFRFSVLCRKNSSIEFKNRCDKLLRNRKRLLCISVFICDCVKVNASASLSLSLSPILFPFRFVAFATSLSFSTKRARPNRIQFVRFDNDDHGNDAHPSRIVLCDGNERWTNVVHTQTEQFK